jgi:hypothetical protein
MSPTNSQTYVITDAQVLKVFQSAQGVGNASGELILKQVPAFSMSATRHYCNEQKQYRYCRCIRLPSEDGMIPVSRLLSRDLHRGQSHQLKQQKRQDKQLIQLCRIAKRSRNLTAELIIGQRPAARMRIHTET